MIFASKTGEPERQLGTRKLARLALSLMLTGLLSACGTSYNIPKASEADVARAQQIFEEENNPATAKSGVLLSEGRAAAQYKRVVARVEPVAEAFCKKQTAEKPAFDCDVRIAVDNTKPERNAYQTLTKEGKPIIAFTLPFIRDARNEDELAFVLGHEFGHHIGQHIQKQQQQALAGAIILGALTAASQSYATQANPYRSTAYDQVEMQRNVAAGMALGQMAFSQTYELESDMIGTYIAKAAGYDPVRGARFFARPEAKKSESGELSFWGTHPPDEKRLATVIATVVQMQSDSDLTAK